LLIKQMEGNSLSAAQLVQSKAERIYHIGGFPVRYIVHCTDLRIHNNTIDRPKRICTLCGTNRSWPHRRLEDELHLVFECPFYNEIRKRYPALFKESCANMNDFMNKSDQYSVAFFISACMSRRRNVMMGISPVGIRSFNRTLSSLA
jgi:hypothetical protein